MHVPCWKPVPRCLHRREQGLRASENYPSLYKEERKCEERDVECWHMPRVCGSIYGQKMNMGSKAALTGRRERGWKGRGRMCSAVVGTGAPTWRVRLREGGYSGHLPIWART